MLIWDKRGYWRMTRLQAYLRWKYTIKPLENFIKWCEE